MAVRAVLWDADGVLQRLDGWVAAFDAAVGDGATAVRAEIFDRIGDALTGRLAMRPHVLDVLRRHGLDDRADAVSAVWRWFDPVSETRDLAAALPVPGYLATNQDDWRAACMRESMGYEDVLAGSYYSCEIGAAKPSAAFFEAILRDLGLAADEVLFVDDGEENVRGARAVGLSAGTWHHSHGVPALRALLARHGVPGPKPRRCPESDA